ncbi:MAG: hypothetical protein PHV11_04450 [Candidatus Bipolaricaulis sp.]|nr:hypothetical protein [Candidatus Bipolaricaulis sp.]
MGTLRRGLEVEKGQTYHVLEQRKIATVYPDGYGLVEFRTRLRVLHPSFAGPIHYFGLSAAVAPGKVIPSINELTSVPIAVVPHATFLNYRTLPPSSPAKRLYATELGTQAASGDEGRVRAVMFEVSPPCDVGDELSYGWEWGFPELFLVESGASDDSSFRCISPVKQLSLELRFVHPSVRTQREFAREPEMVLRRRGAGAGLSLEPERVTDLEYVSFLWHMEDADAGDEFVAVWTYL